MLNENNTENSPLSEGWQSERIDGVFPPTKTPPPTNVGYSSKEENFKINRFKKYKDLPYNPKLKEKAKQLRKAGNLSEVLFWNVVKKRQLLGLDFERQKIIGNYIVDFYCAEFDLVIEIDGQSHDFKGQYDQNRETCLKSLGLKVIHYSDMEIKKGLDTVIGNLYVYLKSKQTPPSP